MLSRSVQIQLKYHFDRIAAFAFLVFLSPILCLIAVAIKACGSGPVFFKQARPGFNGEMFEIWKFRTMVVNADTLLDTRGRTGAARRVTAIGAVLRRLSLDELPQLVNILRGEMSFVGPRPLSVEHLPKLTVEQRRRFRMKPGITGLAQVNGRNTLKWSRRIDFDNRYIEDYSLWLDLKILFQTAVVVVSQDGIVLDRNPQDVDDLGPATTNCDIPSDKRHRKAA